MTPERENRLQAIARDQQGVLTRQQLIDAELSSAAIGRLVKNGRLDPLHRGVYLVGPNTPGRAREMAAVLAGGPAAVLSHTSAVELWSCGVGRAERSSGRGHAGESRRTDPRRRTQPTSRPLHVSVPGSGRGSRPGIIFHRVAELSPDEHTRVEGIPITSPGRTLVDLAGLVGSGELERAVAAMEREGLVEAEELARLPDRYPRRPGVRLLRSLTQGQTAPEFTRSEAERRCLRLLREAGLPRPHTNVPFGPYELDLFWPAERIAIEVDGRAYHSSRRRFEGDRRRDAWLRARGVTVIRLTWHQITRRPVATAVEVGQILAQAENARRSGTSGSRMEVAPAEKKVELDAP